MMCHELKGRYSINWSEINEMLGFADRSVGRWKQRDRDDEPVIQKPGPKKCQEFDLEEVTSEIQQLKTGRKRVQGTTELFKAYQDSISRRDLQALINQHRIEIVKKGQDGMKVLQWNTSGLVWAVDETIYSDTCDQKTAWVDMKDLNSQYKFEPLLGFPQTGERIASWLALMFKRYGPPLFMKRDNGPALNSKEVDQVLSKYFVIPLNSPIYYCKYNGSIEHDHHEIKNLLRRDPPERFDQAGLNNCINHLNHLPRRSLRNSTSCSLFHQKDLKDYSKRKRKDIFDEIFSGAKKLYQKLERANSQAMHLAWRLCCEQWLVTNGHLSISKERSTC